MRLAGGIIAEVFGVPMACRVYQKVRYIPRMAIQREITVKLANSPGALSRVSQLLGGERINMLAMSIDPKKMILLLSYPLGSFLVIMTPNSSSLSELIDSRLHPYFLFSALSIYVVFLFFIA